MRNLLLTATLASLCVPVLSSPALAQYGQSDRRDQSPPGVTVRTTSMRAGPEGGYPLVRSVARGNRVNIYGCLDDRSWCDVSYGNDRGWVTGSDLAAEYQGRQENVVAFSGNFGIGTLTFSFGDYWENNYRQRPFYSERYRWEQHYFERYQSNWGPRPDHSYWGDRTVTGYMLRRSWLRAGPDYDYPTLRRIGRNTQVIVYGCLRDWNWCDVSYQRDRGWVPGQDIAASYQGRRRSINTVAPYLGIGIFSFMFGTYWDDHYRDRSFYRERDRWERQYNQNYKPSWGPRQDDSRDRVQPRRDEQQGQRPVQTQPPVQWQPPQQPPARVPPPVQRQAPGQGQVPGQPSVQRHVPVPAPVQVQPPVQAPIQGHAQGHVPGQPAVQPPGQNQGHVNQKPDPRVKKPKPGDPDYVRPDQPGHKP